jgi:hypothetical protein
MCNLNILGTRMETSVLFLDLGYDSFTVTLIGTFRRQYVMHAPLHLEFSCLILSISLKDKNETDDGPVHGREGRFGMHQGGCGWS